jgi:predicted transposase YbfD/YdcC
MVSAWASRQRLVLGQEAIDAKSNEISAISLLLERIELRGPLFTIDAIGTQTAIAEMIVARGSDYLLALKANRPAHADVAAFFADPPQNLAEDTHETVDCDHGRLGRRRHSVCRETGWLFSDRHYPHELRLFHLAVIAMIESTTECAGKSKPSGAPISHRQSSTPKPLQPPSAPIGTSKTAYTGSSTLSSTTTSHACEPATAHKTWPSLNRSP